MNKVFYVVASGDGDGYPSIRKIFFSEADAIEEAKSYIEGEPKISENPKDFDNLVDEYGVWLGRAEDGGEIVYYREYAKG
ncbi:unnamed protein product [Sphagnum jensenii]